MSEITNTQTTHVKAVVYDLPSENLRDIPNDDVRDMIRSVRVYSVQLLHGLGVQCTESVILVPPRNVERISEVVDKVLRLYEQLREQLRSHNYVLRPEPIIRVLDLTRDQTEALVSIARRHLITSLDSAIARVSELLEALNEITEQSRLRRARANLRRLKNEWNRLLTCATQLGIDISRDYEYLIELIDNAVQQTMR
ncbi:MAG: hypothetical protein QXR84_08880 [Candidatus Bathyarchaeia archaeon]